MVRLALSLVVLAMVASTARSLRSLQTEVYTPTGQIAPRVPRTVPFNWTEPTGSWPLPADDPRISGPEYDGVRPEQIKVIYYGRREVLVTWVTGTARSARGRAVPRRLPSATETTVEVGVEAGVYDRRESGSTTWYDQLHWGFSYARNYSSADIHRVVVGELDPGRTYHYRVRGGRQTWGPDLSFTMPKASFGWPDRAAEAASGVGNAVPTRTPAEVAAAARTKTDSSAFTLMILADTGMTHNSSTTYARASAHSFDAGLIVGDMTYADDAKPDGTLDLWLFNETEPERPSDPSSRAAPALGTFQPRWDQWGRLVQPLLATKAPFLFNVGNHEWEADSTGEPFKSYRARLGPNFAASGSSSPLFYSIDVGPIHLVFLTSYADFGPGSPQAAWLARDLARVDRAATPWVVATFHAPVYSSYAAHLLEAECFRLDIEGILYRHGVDLVLSGHVHAFERTFPVLDFRPDPCAPVHVTLGDGGNVEKLSAVFADLPGNCPPEPRAPVFPQTEACLGHHYDGNFCPSSQPSWSAFREPAFGFTTLQVHNATHATLRWWRNDDEAEVASDEAVLVRGNPACEDDGARLAALDAMRDRARRAVRVGLAGQRWTREALEAGRVATADS